MDTDKQKEFNQELEDAWKEGYIKRHSEPLPWRAWGSWFSWGSPVGLALGWALFIIPLGVFLYLLSLAGML